mgnify:CR=1 FL=1|jgi:hypothetical protein|tara:strand:+ start:6453 stop:6980 length:528 start_codon:yes stop_codon:yes gene_type:complete
MASVSDVLGSIEGDNAYFDPNADELISEGTYPAHIVRLNIRSDISLKNGGSADVYVPTYRLAESAGKFSGEEVDDNGIFRFKGKQRKRSKGGGNVAYKEMLDAVGIPMRETEISGKKVIDLPPVNEHDIFGTPVFVNVFHDTFEGRSGQVTVERARIAHAWGDGDKLDVDDEVPF